MKHFIVRFTIILALLFSVHGISAQLVEPTGGSVVVTATSSMVTLLAGSSVTVSTFTNNSPYPTTGGGTPTRISHSTQSPVVS